MSILSGLINLINPLKGITDGIVQWQIAKENAKTDKDRITADANIKALEIRRDVQVSATVNDKWWSPRTLIGFIVVVFLGKIYIWDSTFGWGVTRPGTYILDTTNVVVGFYFVSEGIRGLFRR